LKGQAERVKAGANSLVRTSQDRMYVARNLSSTETKKRFNEVVKPNSVSRTLKKVGLTMLLSPDPLGPVADVPGVVLLGASYILKQREPANIESVFKETQLIFDELQPLL
jgi:hypothetical protein